MMQTIRIWRNGKELFLDASASTEHEQYLGHCCHVDDLDVIRVVSRAAARLRHATLAFSTSISVDVVLITNSNQVLCLKRRFCGFF